MSYIINVAEMDLPADIHYEMPESVRTELTERFEFDSVSFVSGDFNITQEGEHKLLKGTFTAQLVVEGEQVNIQNEPVELFLVDNEPDEEDFDIADDFEVLENGTLDLEEILAQYVFVEVCYLEAVEDELFTEE